MKKIPKKIDVTFVLDSTGGMMPFFEAFAGEIGTLYTRVSELYASAGKRLASLRANFIDFGDFASDGDDTIHASGFFDMATETDKAVEHVSNVNCLYRGGDLPENALEALYCALLSDWTPSTEDDPCFHYVVLVTDADWVPLGARAGCVGYPADFFPADLEELEAIWNEQTPADGAEKKSHISSEFRRLLLFVPDTPKWRALCDWEYSCTYFVPMASGQAMMYCEVTYQLIKMIGCEMERYSDGTCDD